MSKWISVKEWLPVPGTDVLVQNKNLVCAVCFRIGASTWVESTSRRDELVGYRVTPWMPLPKPPKKEKP